MSEWPSRAQHEQVVARVDTAEGKITVLQQAAGQQNTDPINLGLNETNLISVEAESTEIPTMTTGVQYIGFRWTGIGSSVRHIELWGDSVKNFTMADFSSADDPEGRVQFRTRANGTGEYFSSTPQVTAGVFNGYQLGISGISIGLTPFSSPFYEGFIRPYAGELRIYVNPDTAFPVQTQTRASAPGVTGIVCVNGVVTENKLIGQAMRMMTARPTERKAYGILDGANMPIVVRPTALGASENNFQAHGREGFEIVWPAQGAPYLHAWRIAQTPDYQGGGPTQHFHLPLTPGLPSAGGGT